MRGETEVAAVSKRLECCLSGVRDVHPDPVARSQIPRTRRPATGAHCISPAPLLESTRPPRPSLSAPSSDAAHVPGSSYHLVHYLLLLDRAYLPALASAALSFTHLRDLGRALHGTVHLCVPRADPSPSLTHREHSTFDV